MAKLYDMLIKWILVEWADGKIDVVNVKSVYGDVKPSDLTTGKVVAILKRNGIRRSATVIMSSDDRKFLLKQKLFMTKKEITTVAKTKPRRSRNTSSSPKNTSVPVTQSTVLTVTPSCQSTTKTNSTPKNSTNSVEVMAQTQCVDVGICTDLIITYDQKSQTDYKISSDDEEVFECNAHLTKAVQTVQRLYIMSITEIYGPSITRDININNNEQLDNMFDKVYKRVNKVNERKKLKEESKSQKVTKTIDRKRKLSYDEHLNSNGICSQIGKRSTKNDSTVAEVSSMKQIKSPSINGYCEPSTSKKTPIKYNNTRCSNSLETQNIMVPLGSGHTVIKLSQYEQINWTSHTMATRHLLSAVFPRSVLASHSLTGKRSPAFQHLPPKSCLDQRKVADIIMTVTKMCEVKENLVRATITVKCADENKMNKQKEKKKASRNNSLNFSNESNSSSLNNQKCDSDQENQPIN